MYNPLIEDHHTIDSAQNSKSPFFGIFILDSNSGVELVSHSYSPTRVDLDVNAISSLINFSDCNFRKCQIILKSTFQLSYQESFSP